MMIGNRLVLAGWILTAWCASAQAGIANPNLVIFLSDDQGWGDLSHSGNPHLSTPHIDSLAADGASFDRFYVCPVCSPTRAEFLTGRYHPRSGVYSTSAGGERMDLDETTLADLFREAGYATGAFGKWHNGSQYPYHPNGRGFDQFYGFTSGHWGNYFSPMLDRDGHIVRGQGFCIDDFTDHAIRFMERAVASGQPFLAYLPYNTPHSPMQVPERFWKRFAEHPVSSADANHHRCALAMCENLDWNVGRVLERLDELGVTRDTIVVWFHDNGPNGMRWNGGMRGIKGSTDEGGVRSPLFVRWPSRVEPGLRIPSLCSVRDLLPTLCDLAGVPAKTELALDGISLVPLLLQTARDWPERVLINHWRDRISARSPQFRLDHSGNLYDMIADPGQRHAVTARYPDVARTLREAVSAYRDQVLPGYGTDLRPFIIAPPGAPPTQLPARDAKGHGTLRRSNRYPNCSYFRHWTSVDDTLSWFVRVDAPGAYNIELFYAAREPGVTYELRFKNAVLPFVISEAQAIPERGAENDRHPRGESYVKDFRRMAIGTLRLDPGVGELTLRATDIPGTEAMEFRLLTLMGRSAD